MGAPVARGGSAPTVVPHKRGPPRQRPSQASPTSSSSAASAKSQKRAIATRKTGQPPAALKPEQTPRKRGRPRKNPEHTAPRKRGRPRKDPNDTAPRKKRPRRYESESEEEEASDDPDTDETEYLVDDADEEEDDLFEPPPKPASTRTKAKSIEEPAVAAESAAEAVVEEPLATVPVSRLAYELVVARREADRQSQIMLEGFSFSDLQAQQRELELFQLRKKQRSRAKTRDPQGSAESSHSDEGGAKAPANSSFSPPSSECEPSQIVYVTPPPKFCESESETQNAAAPAFPSIAGVKTRTEAAFVDATVVHPTAWRRLCFTAAPPNILRVDVEPYANGTPSSCQLFRFPTVEC